MFKLCRKILQLLVHKLSSSILLNYAVSQDNILKSIKTDNYLNKLTLE